jgi:hypothetical protein
MATTTRAPPTIASSSASHIFASKLPLLNAFSTPTPDHELNAHGKLVTSVRMTAGRQLKFKIA